MKKQWKTLIFCIAVPLAVGILSALLTRNSMQTFDSINKPGLAVSDSLDDPVYSYGNRVISGGHVQKTKRLRYDHIRTSAYL